METCAESSKVQARGARTIAGRFDRYVLAALCAALVSAVAVFFLRVRIGLTLWEYGDETQYFVAAQMITQGYHLYRDTFTHHGPLPVIISHLYTVAIDRHDFSYLRLSQVLLASFSCAAVLLSPILKTWSARIFAASVYVSLLSAVWLPKILNMLLYPSVCGYLSVIALAQCIVPLLFREKINPWNLFVGGAALSLAGFTAYPLFLSGLLFILSSFVVARAESPSSRGHIRFILVGTVAATAAVLLWLLIYGDILGYFIYHIYFNQWIYSKYTEYSLLSILNNLSLSLMPQNLVHTVAVLLMGGWILIFLRMGVAQLTRLALGVRATSIGLIACGVLFANPTGDIGEHNTAFLIPDFALLAIAVALLLQRNTETLSRWSSTRAVIATVAAVVVIEWAAPAGSLFGAITDKSPARLKPEASEIYEFVRSITREDGDLLALVYNQIVYVRAARLPASGNFYYLPWQAAYNRNAFKGYKIDVCSDIQRRRPAVISFFNWRVWDKYPIEIYEPCILTHIVEEYAPIGFNSPWYVRKDILQRYTAEFPRDLDSEMALQSTLQQTEKRGSGVPVPILMTPEHEERATPLRRLGVLFASSASQGDAELSLQGPDGATFSMRFSLSGIASNRYHYFELRPNVYRSGEIRSISKNEVRIWEGRLEHSRTCLVYEYVDSSRAYTPACPLADPFNRTTVAQALRNSGG